MTPSGNESYEFAREEPELAEIAEDLAEALDEQAAENLLVQEFTRRREVDPARTVPAARQEEYDVRHNLSTSFIRFLMDRVQAQKAKRDQKQS